MKKRLSQCHFHAFLHCKYFGWHRSKHVGIYVCLLRAIGNKEGDTFVNVEGRERNMLMREIKLLLLERGRERKNFKLIETILP